MKHLFLFLIIILGFCLLKYSKFEDFVDVSYILPSAEIKVSQKINGRGVFATKKYYKDDVIELCPCITDKRENFKGKMKDYLFKYDDENALVAFGFCSLYNHSDNYNARWKVLSDSQLKIYASKDIENGEEIFISYGNPYWENRQYQKI